LSRGIRQGLRPQHAYIKFRKPLPPDCIPAPHSPQWLPLRGILNDEVGGVTYFASGFEDCPTTRASYTTSGRCAFSVVWHCQQSNQRITIQRSVYQLWDPSRQGTQKLGLVSFDQHVSGRYVQRPPCNDRAHHASGDGSDACSDLHVVSSALTYVRGSFPQHQLLKLMSWHLRSLSSDALDWDPASGLGPRKVT
jgi:hypothetical protein